MKGAREAQIKSREIDQHDRVRSGGRDLVHRLAKFLPEIAVMLDHLPQADDAGFVAPIDEALPAVALHLRAAPA